MKGISFSGTSVRKGGLLFRNLLWIGGGMYGALMISCATISTRPLSEKPPFDALLESLFSLPVGGQLYVGIWVAAAKDLRAEIEKILPSSGNVRQGLDLTEQIGMAWYASGEGQNGWLALLQGRYPSWQLNWALWWHPDWKKRRSAEGIPFWYNSRQGFSLQVHEESILLSNTPESTPFTELLKRLRRPTEISFENSLPLSAETDRTSSFQGMPGKNSFSFFFSRQRGKVLLIGWLNDPSQTLAASFATLSLPLSVPIERISWVLEELSPESTEKKAPYCMYLAVQTPSVSHARALGALVRLSQRFMGTIPLAGDAEQDPLVQLLVSLLSKGNVQQEEAFLVIESEPIPSQDIALLFSRLLVYSTSKKTIP